MINQVLDFLHENNEVAFAILSGEEVPLARTSTHRHYEAGGHQAPAAGCPCSDADVPMPMWRDAGGACEA